MVKIGAAKFELLSKPFSGNPISIFFFNVYASLAGQVSRDTGGRKKAFAACLEQSFLLIYQWQDM